MIRDEWQTWAYMLLAVVVVLWVVALFGCASEPESPITMYRVMYGFEPDRYRVVYDQNQQLEK